jgi:hypothetical protein
MHPKIKIVLAACAVLGVSMSAIVAQEDRSSFKDGAIEFDKKGFKAEYDKMQRDLAKRAKTKRGEKELRSKTYCIDCAGPPTEKLVCRAIVGGRIGKALCTLGGAVSCPAGANVGNVTEGPC